MKKVRIPHFDWTGQIVGRLTVLGPSTYRAGSINKQKTWECRCSCRKGTIVQVRTENLRKGMTRSCGCLKSENLTGMVFGRLTVLEKVIKDVVTRTGKKRRVHYWLCKCSCPQQTVKLVQSSHLRSGSVLSCGCIHREMLPKTKYLPGNHFVLKEYMRSARDRGLAWELSDEEAFALFQGNCHYTGDAPATVKDLPHRKVKVDYSYNGIDRIDSSKGYIPGNVVSCSTAANYSKRNYDYEDYIVMCNKVARLHPRDLDNAAITENGGAL